ncbi:LysR family transcriptional regulator [Granulicella mallensis]|jgi:LysR family transcriptional regulator, hydrogen peroxide-inducible genes activator|uniref:LysR family hydrogen peroxide-inducible transcriptional activator n=1 Tax=Granulicella mallensis TaxID=940614 RepID=A0A7W8E7I8_9BACT|nr:hydrogen peroxide-inducible genes activator [Granulicella mallensis]MBB5061787.1 LysR family hydrogen peroxide-inducible transcriptional activator [Granulicella mallensis]
MEIHQLRYVCAIAETGSFSRAAERCQVAQPSLSQQVLKLEEDLGSKLFDRLGRSIRLTEAGRAFLPHARSILTQMETARSSVTDKCADVRGSVSVGVIPTIAPYLMPHYTKAFTRKHPEAKLRIVEETTPILLESLRNLSIDLAILALPLRYKDLELFPLCTEPLFAVLPKEHPLAGSESLALKDLRGEPFVMLRDGHCFRDLSIAACTRARVAPRIAFESGQFSSLFGMVAAGVGISLVPEMAIDRNAGCRYVRLSDTRATRTIVAATLRGRSFNRVQQAFLSGIQKAEQRIS